MKQRNLEIDLTKGILTVGMVLSHSFKFLADNSDRTLIFISTITDLVSFSGFLFCFGYAAWTAYLQKDQLPWPNIWKTMLKCYIAFIISAVGFRVLVNAEAPSLSLLARIAAVRNMPPFSEFLLAFAVITLLGAVLQKLIVRATQSWQSVTLASIICLAVTFLTSKMHFDPLISQFVGGQGFIGYPIISYLPLFLLGIFRARHSEQSSGKYYFMAAAAGILLYVGFIALDVSLNRFPPSAGWILSSTGIFFVYYLVAHIVHTQFPRFVQKYFNAVGQNVLLYLLLSNLVLFTSYALRLQEKLSTAEAVLFYAIFMGFTLFLQFIAVDLTRTNQSMNQESS
jgi:hypothetical protein